MIEFLLIITYEASTPGFSVFAVFDSTLPASMESTAYLIVTAEGLSEFAAWQLLVMIAMASGIFAFMRRRKVEQYKSLQS